MAFEVAGLASLQISFEAAVDLSTHQFKFVKLNSAGKIVLCDTDGEVALGVLQDNPKLGQAGNVMLYGISKIVVAAGEAILLGDALGGSSMVGTTGVGTGTLVQSTVSGADLADMMMGMWLEAVTGSSPAKTLGTILIRPMGRVAAT